MIASRGWLRAATALAGLSAVLAAAAPASATTPAATSQLAPMLRRALPEPPPAEGARNELGVLNGIRYLSGPTLAFTREAIRDLISQGGLQRLPDQLLEQPTLPGR
ncbi:hypothetical protein ACIBCO_41235 [Streptomyces violascens]|uniref:hypothetical protein n=1 Tax=Streptomyces violascens TaxID=67381 RepID=UPI0037AF60F1